MANAKESRVELDVNTGDFQTGLRHQKRQRLEECCPVDRFMYNYGYEELGFRPRHKQFANNYDTSMVRRPTDPRPTRALPLNGDASSERDIGGGGCHMRTSDPSSGVTMRLDPNALTIGSDVLSVLHYYPGSSPITLILNNNQGTVNLNFGSSSLCSSSGGEPPARPPRSTSWMISAISFLGAWAGRIWSMLCDNNAGLSRSSSVQGDRGSWIRSAIRFLWAKAGGIWWMGSFFTRGFYRIAKLCFSIIKPFL